MEKVLAPREVLHVDTESLVGFSNAGDFSVRCIPGCMNCCCGGQGMFNNHIVGPGLVITESMSLGKLKKTFGNVREGDANTPKWIKPVFDVIGLFNLLVQSFGPKYNLACSISA